MTFMLLALAAPNNVWARGTLPDNLGGWQPGPEAYNPGRVIVRFSDAITAEAATESIQRLGYSISRVAEFKATANFPIGARFGIVELPEGYTPDNAVNALNALPGIMYAQKDWIYYLDSAPVIPNDKHFDKMWGLHNENCQYRDPEMQGDPIDDADIDMPEAWVISTGSEEIIVAVIDSGCYIDHPDLADNIWVNPGEIPGNGIDDDKNGYIDDINGWDFYNNDNSVFDPDERDMWNSLMDEHGTHVAGTIGAASNNAIGVAGVNWNVKILPLKFIGPQGGASSDAILALEYAAAKGAKIVNCSWGGGPYDQALKDAIESSGMLVVCAAGNDGKNTDLTPHYPSSYDLDNIIAVAASMQNDEPCVYPGWWSTSYGAQSVDLFAPGGYILSTLPPDPPTETPREAYGYFYGSSMATPHVSGVAALLHATYPRMPLYPGAPGCVEGGLTVKDRILDSVDVKPAFQGKALTGGRLNAAAALSIPDAPIITSASASPIFGRPPLTVTFSGAATSPVGEIVDKWWDFGDGSDSVHEYDAVHTYLVEGTYTATLTVVDSNGVTAEKSVKILVGDVPQASVDPSEFRQAMRAHRTRTEKLVLTNTGEADLVFTSLARMDDTTEQTKAEGNTVSWLSVVPSGGTLTPGDSIELDVVFDLTSVCSGPLAGAIVLETNDVRAPQTIVPVHIDVIPNSGPVITGCGVNPQQGPVSTTFQFVASAHDPDGTIADKYWDFGDGSEKVGDYLAQHLYAEEGIYTATFHVVDNDGYEATSVTTVYVQEPPSASWSPNQISVEAAAGGSASAILTLRNAGTGSLRFGTEQLPNILQLPERQMRADDVSDPDQLTADGLGIYDANPQRSAWLPAEAGTIIRSWRSPSPIVSTWGVTVNLKSGNIIISDPDSKKDFVVMPDGAYTGTSWSTPWASSWPGDMAFDGEHVWQVSVGGSNGIFKLHPETGEILGTIARSPWAHTSQRGLAYNSNDDTFYIGGWKEDIIYHIKGESWDEPGEVIEEWSLPVTIAGLAYHPIANILAVTSNASPDTIYFVDVQSHAVVGKFPHPMGGEYSGAGCEFDVNGNLWVASQADNSMYLVETGLGPINGDWLSWTPAGGNVEPNGAIDIAVTVDAENLCAGTHTANVVLLTNDIDNPMIVVPVTAHISTRPMITEATAAPTLGDPPLEVAFHVAFAAPDSPVANYGWDFGDGTTSTELDTTHTYTELGNYTSVFSVVDELGGRAEVSFPIEVKWLPHAKVAPAKIEVTLPSTATTAETVTISNVDGHVPLTFTAKVRRGSAPVIAMPERTGAVLHPDARTAEGLCKPMDPAIVDRIAEATGSGKEMSVGDVILSWPVPIEVLSPWGLGFDKTNLWISDSDYYANHIVTPEGVHTGKMLDAYWAGAWPGDMAYDPNHELMWQVNVGGDNGIYGLDPATGAVVESITSGGAWTTVSQRGLAYDDETDTFYIGGWNQDIVYHIKGLSWDEPGATIDQWYFPVSIGGMAWHPDGVLWIASNAIPDMIYGVDVATRGIVAQFQHPFRGMNSVAGLVTNRDGNLWVMSLSNRTVYLVYTGMPISGGVSVSPGSGSLEIGQTAELTVSIDASEVAEPGKDGTKHLEILTNDPINPALHVNIIVHVEPVPSISDVLATPSVGEPPLKVAFEAKVASTARPVVDVWWDFGDGSEPVHEAVAEHVYEKVGQYEATLHAVDEYGVETSASTTITVKWLPKLEVEPERIDVTLPAGTEKQTVLTVVNKGKAPMNFHVMTSPGFAESPEWKSYCASEHVRGEYALEPTGYAGAGIGGPDTYGYMWMDSNQPNGPKFEWVEISDVGTRVRVGDDYGAKVALPFEFPFYGESKTEIGIAAPGYLSFDTNVLCGFWINKPIADGEPPNDLLAVFWDDLDTYSGDVYYYYDEPGERFIVEYKNVGQWAGGTSLTFEAILKPNGSIIYQYLSMTGNPASATVGIENASGDDGLEVVYNAPYIEDGLAVAFAPVGPIIRVNSDSGYLVSGGKQDVVLTLGSPDATPGTYSLLLYVSSDDPYRPELTVPVTVRLTEGPTVNVISPASGERWNGIQAIEYEAIGVDSEQLAIMLEYDCLADDAGWQVIAEGLENTGKYLWDTSKLSKGGFYKVRVTATDPDGATGQDVSGQFTINVLSRAIIAAPNPAQSLVTFYYDIETEGKLFVYDIAGRLVYSAELSAASNVHEWNVMVGDRPVASGLYLYVVVTDGGETSEVGRLVIQR